MPNPSDMPGAQNPEQSPTVDQSAAQPPTPTTPPPAAGQQPPAPSEPPPATAPKPPWEQSGEQFDPDRAWNLVQNLRNELAEYKTKADPVLEEHERLRRASQTELDRAKEDLDAITGERDTWKSQAVRAKAETLASGKFVDAETALALIGDLSEFTTTDGIDTAKLTARLEQLAVDKPFLVTPTQPAGFAPNRAQGQSGAGQLPIDAQIKAAQERGDLMTSIGLKQQQLYKK